MTTYQAVIFAFLAVCAAVSLAAYASWVARFLRDRLDAAIDSCLEPDYSRVVTDRRERGQA